MACMVDFAVLVLESIAYCSYRCFAVYTSCSGPTSDVFTKSIMDVIWQPAKF